MIKNTKLSPPWETIHSEIEAFFEGDDAVVVDKEITEDYTLGISCYNEKKFKALDKILRKEYVIGNVTLKIFVYLLSDRRTNATSFTSKNPAKIVEDALRGNSIFDRIESREIMGSDISYCLFKKQVIQFYNDDLTDLYGLESTLAEDIARDIFVVDDVYFCTSKK